ncbi:lambda family phage portal protein [Sulfitobacter undariae]|uniref:Lambda family phage portal protein n=1 Tax=Sulfitobacter undariae TaxID=1563671 RepID=A0A7W6H2X9_9RHOB|nr:phage portal protein [Sulfitobacter undariae]MBB3995299.1 lambda family phage portal protein [Sulfitobacter undariae]
MSKHSYPRVREGSVKFKSQEAAAAARGMGLFGSAPYVAGDSHVETMQSFNPSNSAADSEVLNGRDKVSARTRDLSRNNGWAAGAITKECDSIIGGNFRPFLKPDWRLLGLSSEWAKDFKEEVEGRWGNYADDPRKFGDTTRSQSMSQMFGTAYRSYVVEGEAIALVNWRRMRPTKTTLRIVDPDLLCNPMDAADQKHQRGGIDLSRDGVAQAYHFRQGHPGSAWADVGGMTWKRIGREGQNGRPQVIHFYDKLRDGQTRGISRMAPIVETLRMEQQYSKVELQAAVINAVLAAFIRSPMGPDMIDEMFGEGDGSAVLDMNVDRQKFYGDNGGIKIGGARLSMLYPNDEIGMVPTARPSAQFADFEGAILRQIASGIGMSYEQLASDWSKTNYSSARAAMIEIWRGWTAKRTAFAQGFCQPFFMAWLEEMIMDGHIKIPNGAPEFYSHWPAYARAKWIGPGKGFVDPVKEAQAAALRVSLGLSTLEEEAAELTGSDWSDNIEQIKSEMNDMPEGTLHPMAEKFAKLLGNTSDNQTRSED